MASKSGFGARQLLNITKNCTRWSGIESLPPAIRKKLEELDALTEHLQQQSTANECLSDFLASVKSGCVSLRVEFNKAQISFDCPSCPLRPGDLVLQHQ